MPRFEDSIEVAVPTQVAYDQWTQFEEFPAFMEGVERVVQRDDRNLTGLPRSPGSARNGRR